MKQFSNFYLLILLLFFSYSINAQDKQSNNWVKLNGLITISNENYSYNNANYDNFRPRYPDNILRLTANATLHISKYFNIPFGLNISNQKTTYNIPTLPEEGLYNYVRSPRNNFHINPNYKWMHFKLGSNTPKFSELTTGNIQIFGVGFDINPKKIIFSGSYGNSQIAVEPDALLNIQGAYKQTMMAARLGWGKLSGSKVTLNVVKVKDDVNSVIDAPIGVKPVEGINVSPYIELKLSKNIDFKTETAASVKTTDLLAANDMINYDNQMITINNSSTVDYSHITSLTYHNKSFSIGGEYRYIGPGYLFVGYRNQETDLKDYRINTSARLAKNKVNVKATFGIRQNNIKNTKLSTNKRFIANINVFSQINEQFSLSATYNNFGFRNNVTDNSLKVEMVNNSFSITPTYQIKSKTNFQQISVSANIDRFNQYDFFTDAYINTAANSYNANYVLTFKNNPLMLGVNALYLENKSDLLNLNLLNYGANVGYKFFDKKLYTMLMATMTSLTRDEFTADNRLNLRLKLKYKISKTMTANLLYSLNNNRYGSYRPDAISNENRIQVSLTKKL